MFTKTNIAIAATTVFVIGANCAAMAAPKHAGHHQRTVVERQVPAAAYQSFGSAHGIENSVIRTPQVTCIDETCDPYDHQQVKCIGGACDPEWGIDGNE
jgi:hypothetical protein